MENEILEYFGGDELAASVWKGKYAQEGEKTPDEMFRRMAKEFARVDANYQLQEVDNKSNIKLSDYGKERCNLTEDIIFNLFKGFKYLVPQGSIMNTLGTDKIASLSNCVVIPSPEDSYNSIMYADTQLTALYKRRCGVGLDISNLRPATAEVNNAANSTTGATSFMERFSNTTREVAMNGRRGALMITMDINHPDILEFIKIKRDLSKVTGANISIRLNDEFMEAVKNDEHYVLRFPCTMEVDNWATELELNKLTKLTKGKYYKLIKAKEYWNEIIKSAHSVAEPGLLFWDNMINYSPDGVYEQYKPISTNPCSEIGMSNDSCRLMVLNYFSFVENPFAEKASFDFDKFYKYNYEALRLMDDLVDLEIEHIDRILAKIDSDPEPNSHKQIEKDTWNRLRKMGIEGRRIGLGFTALGDTLAALGFKYDSEDAIEFIEKLFKLKMKSELNCTTDLSILRGSFEGWDVEKEFYYDVEYEDNDEYNIHTTTSIGGGNNSFYANLFHLFEDESLSMMLYGRRNISWSTVAPTGSVSILTQTTSGIEPLFSPYYFRRKKINPNEPNSRVDFVDQNGDSWTEYPVLHPKFKDWIISSSYSDLEGVDAGLSKDYLKHCYEKSPWYMSTANDINWEKRVKIQGHIQKYITHSISSTINLPSDVSEDEVSKIYFEAWKNNLKGITVYRDGSRSGVLITESAKNNANFEYKDAVKRPKSIKGEAFVTTIKGEQFNVIVGVIDDKPYEIFAFLDGKSKGEGKIIKHKRGDYRFEAEGVEEQLLSTVMTDEQSAITRLISTSLRHGTDIKHIVEQLSKSSGNISSFSSALSRILKKYIKEGEKASGITCTECGSSNIIFEEGCLKCADCGNSKCG